MSAKRKRKKTQTKKNKKSELLAETQEKKKENSQEGLIGNQDKTLEALIEIVIGEYRFRSSIEKVVNDIEDIQQRKKIQSQYGWLRKTISKAADLASLSIVDLTGQDYDAGMAVTPLNLEDFPQDEDLVVDNMIEPIILTNGELKRNGTVMLGRKNK